jgi:rhamnosyltransferase
MILTAAVVVGYFPEASVISKLLISLSSQVDILILVDNGGSENVAKSQPVKEILTRYVKLERNFGLGYALNRGFELASTYKVDYVVTFDQDSAPPAVLVKELLTAHMELKDDGIKCAGIGPVFFDRREEKKNYFPFYRQEGNRITSYLPTTSNDYLVKSDVLITSGMMVNMSAWLRGHHFNPGFFVDYTDTEWCFRVRSHGFHLFGHLKTEMGHALSEAPPKRFLGLKFFEYSPVRRYYYYRNTILFCKLSYVSWVWRLRLLTGLLIRFTANVLTDTQKAKSLNSMLKGIWHGILGRAGPYHG